MMFKLKFLEKLNFHSVIVGGTLLFFLVGAIYFFSIDQLSPGIALLILPFPILFLYTIFANPRIGFISVLFANYFALGLVRYIPGPLGLSVDILLLLTWLSLIFSQFNKKVVWNNASNEYTLIAILWFGMTVFQLFNPEARSSEAWFYAMRGVSLYILLTVPLVFILFNRFKDFELLIKLSAWFTILAVLKGLQQKIFGVDPWEQQWLDAGASVQHCLARGLRVFSFFSDAGNYGGSMGFFGVVFTILGIHTSDKRKKYFYFLVGLGATYGMLISGTRGAIAVPLVGFSMYAVLTKRIKIILIGGGTIVLLFILLKFTTIGQSNYEISRFRSGMSSDNDSFQVRQINQQKFKNYLSTRPFGGGIGTAGYWGLRFSPNTFLAKTPTDGWYIQIWAEQGIVGLSAYLLMILYFVGKSSYLIFFKIKNKDYLYKAIAFTAGMYGVIVTSYSTTALGQMPNLIIIFTSMSFIYMMPRWEKEDEIKVLEIENNKSIIRKSQN